MDGTEADGLFAFQPGGQHLGVAVSRYLCCHLLIQLVQLIRGQAGKHIAEVQDSQAGAGDDFPMGVLF